MFWATIIFVSTNANSGGAEKASQHRESAKLYRFIYNRDGCCSYGAFDGDAEKWVQHEFSRLENSAVDLIAWCFDGGNAAEYDSDILQNPGDADLKAGYGLPSCSTCCPSSYCRRKTRRRW